TRRDSPTPPKVLGLLGVLWLQGGSELLGRPTCPGESPRSVRARCRAAPSGRPPASSSRPGSRSNAGSRSRRPARPRRPAKPATAAPRLKTTVPRHKTAVPRPAAPAPRVSRPATPVREATAPVRGAATTVETTAAMRATARGTTLARLPSKGTRQVRQLPRARALRAARTEAGGERTCVEYAARRPRR